MINLTNLKMLIFDILFPPLCVGCKNTLKSEEKQGIICAACSSKIVVHNTLFCGRCRARLPENKKTCHKDHLYLLGAATDYDEIVRNLIHQFKYQKWTRLSPIFKNILEKYLKNIKITENQDLFFENFIIIPMPLHKNREEERGFNQASLLAEIISNILQLPVISGAFLRIKETAPQAKIKDWQKRKENLENSFFTAMPEKIKNKNIILVDDIFTSGATMNEAAKTLKKSGAKKIIAFVLAKTAR